MTQQPGGQQQNQLMQLLQLLGMGGQRQQNRQPYANSGYYPNLPRYNQGTMSPLTQPGQLQQNPGMQQSMESSWQRDPAYKAEEAKFIKAQNDFMTANPGVEVMSAPGMQKAISDYNAARQRFSSAAYGNQSNPLMTQNQGMSQQLNNGITQQQLLSLLLGF